MLADKATAGAPAATLSAFDAFALVKDTPEVKPIKARATWSAVNAVVPALNVNPPNTKLSPAFKALNVAAACSVTLFAPCETVMIG